MASQAAVLRAAMRQYARQCPSGGTETCEPIGRTAGPTEAAHAGGKQKSGKATAAVTCSGTTGVGGSSAWFATRSFFLEGAEELLELEEEDDEEEEEVSDDELESDGAAALPDAAALECADWLCSRAM